MIKEINIFRKLKGLLKVERFLKISTIPLFHCSIIPVFCFSAFSQETKFTVSLSKNEVAVGERFQITFQLNASGSNFTPSSFDKFSVYSGPNQSTSMQWINGAMSSSISYSFIVAANSEGEITIGSASIKVKGQIYKTEPIKIKVVKGTSQQQQSQQQSQQQQQKKTSSNDFSDYVFIKLYLDKNRVYTGEQIIATYKLYFRTNIVNNDVERLPSYNGFYTQDIELPQQASISQEVLDGIAYNVATIKQTILFPQRTGTLEVDALAMNIVLRVQDNSRPRSIFDQFFGTYRDVKYLATSNIGKVEVSPLPSNGKPSDFSGAVGKFTMETMLDNNKVKANEAVNLKVTITGKGNIKLIEPFKINFPSDFETYDPKVNDKISANSSGLSGKKEFEYLVIPRHSGSFSIEPFSFSYFDNVSKQYVTLNSGEIKIDVEKEDEKENAQNGYSTIASKEDVKFLGKDIRFIKSGAAELREKNKYFFSTAKFYSLLISPFVCLLFFVFLKRKYEEKQSDGIGRKSSRARKMAAKRLSSAKKFLGTNEKVKFYEEIFKALYGYLSDKLIISVSDLSKEKISGILKNRNVSAAIISELVSVLDRCEMARFAPVSDVSENQVYESSVEIISKVEEEIK